MGLAVGHRRQLQLLPERAPRRRPHRPSAPSCPAITRTTRPWAWSTPTRRWRSSPTGAVRDSSAATTAAARTTTSLNWTDPVELKGRQYPQLAGGPSGLFLLSSTESGTLSARRWNGTTFGAPATVATSVDQPSLARLPGRGRPAARGVRPQRRQRPAPAARRLRRRGRLALGDRRDPEPRQRRRLRRDPGRHGARPRRRRRSGTRAACARSASPRSDPARRPIPHVPAPPAAQPARPAVAAGAGHEAAEARPHRQAAAPGAPASRVSGEDQRARCACRPACRKAAGCSGKVKVAHQARAQGG